MAPSDEPRMLSAGEVLAHLMSLDLVTAETVVEGDLSVADASRRHCNFKVVSTSGRSYFVKQEPGQEGIGSVSHEAAIYRLLASVALNNGDDLRFPCCHAYDPQRGVLVLDFLPNAETLREHHLRRKCFPIRPALLAGRALGTLHGPFTREVAARCDSELRSREPPTVLSTSCPPLEMFQSVSQATVTLIKRIQQFPQFCEALEGVQQSWRAETFVHRDVRWDNCLLLSAAGTGRQRSLRLIDWEYAGLGDPAWDVGSFFSQYLSFWVLSVPEAADGSPNELAAPSTSPIGSMQPALRAFWQAYVRKAALDPLAAQERLLRATSFAAVCLVQAAFEHLHSATQVSRAAAHLVQLSMNILERPQDAGVRLLGIPFAEPAGA